MSAPHQEMHELTAEVGPVARAMLSAALAVVQARQQRRLTAARAAEAAQRASGERAASAGPRHRGTITAAQRGARHGRDTTGQRRAAGTALQPPRHPGDGGHDGGHAGRGGGRYPSSRGGP